MAKKKDRDESQYHIRSAERVCDLLDLLIDSAADVGLQQLATGTEMPKSTTYRYLLTLEARGYVFRGDDGEYRVGFRMRDLQAAGLETLRRIASPLLVGLRDRLGEAAGLAVLDGGSACYLAVLPSPHPMRVVLTEGERQALHAGAVGKALLAQLAEEEVLPLLKALDLQPLTAATITDPHALLEEVARVRERGWALEQEERAEGVSGVAVAIRGARPIALGIAAPTLRLPEQHIANVAVTLAEAAQRLRALIQGGQN